MPKDAAPVLVSGSRVATILADAVDVDELMKAIDEMVQWRGLGFPYNEAMPDFFQLPWEIYKKIEAAYEKVKHHPV